MICRFGPADYVNGTPTVLFGVLYRRLSLDRPTAQRLALAADRINTSKPSGVASCPADDGAASIIVFHYSTGADVDLWLTDTGCLSIDNGTIGAWEISNPSFYNDFESVFRQIVGNRS